MSPPESSTRAHVAPARRGAILGGALVAIVLAIYANSLGAPFVFDDIPAIERNATIRHLWPPGPVLNPPVDGGGVVGRPLVNLSLAVNYALGGLEVRGYRAGNIALHALSVLVLWGVLRRTLRRTEYVRAKDSEFFAWCAAALWAAHPLLTESVVCIVQRNEILGSLFYLLSLYGFIRGVPAETKTKSGTGIAASRPSGGWLTVSWLACGAGVASKEMVATAPLLVFLYDRAFVAGTFREAWRSRRLYYAALASTWLLLAWLMQRGDQRGGTVGFGLGISSWDYLLTQARGLLLYLKLSVWPHPLVLDYGWSVAPGLSAVWWQATIVVTLLAATVVALVRRPAIGFLGASFFVILAPSSSIVPLTTQTLAEHRMYLPLAPVLVLFLLAVYAGAGRKALAAGVVAAVLLGGATVRRNWDYRSELAIWTDTVAKCPGNARAHGNLGRAYLMLGRWEEAVAACKRELEVDPAYRGDARVNIGRALTELGRASEAIPYFEEALALNQSGFDVHNNYGIALAAVGRLAEAIEHYETALRLQPDSYELHNNLANALVKAGRLPAALEHYETALRLKPDFVDAATNWGRALAENGRVEEALPHFEWAARERPGVSTEIDLANALSAAGRTEEAVAHYEAILKLQPNHGLGHLGLGNALVRMGRVSSAVQHFEAAARLLPDEAEAQHNLAAALMLEGRREEALPYFRATVRLLPTSADAHHELALVLGDLRRWDEAIQHDLEAVRLQPGHADAREHLAWLRQQRAEAMPGGTPSPPRS